MEQHPIEKMENHLYYVLGHVQDEWANKNLIEACNCLSKIKDERNEHNELIRVCSPIVTEEDGSDLIPNWARVQNALMRLISERDSYKAGLADLYDVARNGMIGDDALCMVNAEKLLEQ